MACVKKLSGLLRQILLVYTSFITSQVIDPHFVHSTTTPTVYFPFGTFLRFLNIKYDPWILSFSNFTPAVKTTVCEAFRDVKCCWCKCQNVMLNVLSNPVNLALTLKIIRIVMGLQMDFFLPTLVTLQNDKLFRASIRLNHPFEALKVKEGSGYNLGNIVRGWRSTDLCQRHRKTWSIRN